MHLLRPVAERVHHELQAVRMAHVQAVPRSRVVQVVAAILLRHPVVRGVVEALEGQHGAAVVPLGGVVVDDVEDDLDAGGMQRLHHALELADRIVRVAGAHVVGVRREEPDRVVPPVVPQSAIDEVTVMHEVVYRQQFDRRDSQADEVVGGGAVGQARVGAAEVRWNVRHPRREALDVHLVDEGFVERRAQQPVAAPVERRIDDDRSWNVRSAVHAAHRIGVVVGVRQHRGVPLDRARDARA